MVLALVAVYMGTRLLDTHHGLGALFIAIGILGGGIELGEAKGMISAQSIAFGTTAAEAREASLPGVDLAQQRRIALLDVQNAKVRRWLAR